MLARYYVYEQHVGRGRKSARKPRKGIGELELVEKKRGEDQKTTSVGKLTG